MRCLLGKGERYESEFEGRLVNGSKSTQAKAAGGTCTLHTVNADTIAKPRLYAIVRACIMMYYQCIVYMLLNR